MGRSSGARKKANIKPWHTPYARLNLSGLVGGVIPKRIRAIEGAKARLKTARTVRAAAVEWRHIDTNLSAIDSVYTKIRTALRNGGIPGRLVKFNIPKFDESSSTSNTKVIKSDDLATAAIKKGESVQKHIKDEFEDELEDGEVKDEIKEETEDEPGCSRSKHTLPANGLSDFGTWFQDRVTGSKKKLSHLEHVSAPTGKKQGS
ncbi:hypothetical protein INS49_009275 [Diaporthe citri]|uniref:uncharacterized protein n=1 Tax=Diaporthe citri TaxID=83186 RepID=UPI001C7EE76E|nr:uncharacterized protein INS49_009275 [Diaporthe citri]KAG6361055.1 hypothetical protein INS49_009275 [Diaporthe citri]